jgi:hypothetical protein
MTVDAAQRARGLPPAVRLRIFLYLGALVTLLAIGSPFAGLIDIPLSFLLKNKLHLEAHDLAFFRLVAAIPLYFSFVFGFVRDSLNPLGMHDRGFMVLFAAISAVLYGIFACIPTTYLSILAAVTVLTASFLFVASAQNGLATLVAQQHTMSGQVSAVWNVFLSIPTLLTYLVGGDLSDLLESKTADEAAHVLFLIGGATMILVAAYALWRPKTVFDNVSYESRVGAQPLNDVKRLIRHWPIYPALLIWLLWNFAPGSVTPLQYYLQNTLHARDAQWGQWNAIFSASFIPTFLVFGILCQTFALRVLLLWGTVIAIPQLVPLLFIESASGALTAAVPIGLMGGVATAAYLDLIIRSSPRGLEGTVLMLSAALNWVAVRFGDVLGTILYTRLHGFAACVAAITLVYALILPVLWLVPKHLIATPDGQPPEIAPALPCS